MTNREWLFSLTCEELAQFLTLGMQYRIPVSRGHDGADCWYGFINIQAIARSYTDSTAGVEKWLEEEYDGRYDQ